MPITDNVVALREMSKAAGEIGNDCQGRRTFAQMLLDAADEIETLRGALKPFARKAYAFDWRKGSIYKTFKGEEFTDDQARVLLDTIEVAKASGRHLSIGDFRRARDVCRGEGNDDENLHARAHSRGA